MKAKQVECLMKKEIQWRTKSNSCRKRRVGGEWNKILDIDW